MAKYERILGLFPSFYEALENYKLLHTAVSRLSQPLEEADTHLFRIQRAHRLLVAEQPEDILRLAALLNLFPFHFEDILTPKALACEEKLDLMRQRIQRLAQVHLTGLGTPQAILESTAIFLNALIVPSQAGASIIKHLDAEGFSHEAVIEFFYLPEKPRKRLYLHENPLRRRQEPLSERWPPNVWGIDNQSISAAAPAKFVVQGVAERTVLPGFYCPQTQQGILFNGIVPQGRTLVIDAVGGVTLDDRPVDEWLIGFEGGVVDLACTDQSAFVIEDATGPAPFDGKVEAIMARPFRRRKSLPVMPAGRSTWHFTVAEGVFEQHGYDFAVYALPHAPIGLFDGDFQFEACVFDYEASAIAGMAWDERIPCAFKLLLPAELPQPQSTAASDGDASDAGEKTAEPLNHVSRIGSLISRFRAAGVQAFVDSAREAWILGEGVLRSPEAAGGPGTQSLTTRLQDWHTELLVSPD
jgi:hypothetical protein